MNRICICLLLFSPFYLLQGEEEKAMPKHKESEMAWLVGFLTLKIGGYDDLSIPDDHTAIIGEFVNIGSYSAEGGKVTSVDHPHLYSFRCQINGKKWGVDFSTKNELQVTSKGNVVPKSLDSIEVGAVVVWRTQVDGSIKTAVELKRELQEKAGNREKNSRHGGTEESTDADK